MIAGETDKQADRRRRTARLPYPLAAAAVGVLVTVLGLLLVFAGERGCDAIRGTATCGSVGGLLLLAIVASMVFLGTRLLRSLRVPEVGVASVLGVTLLAIAVLTVLLDHIFSPWMWLVLPAVAAVAYGFAAWAAAALARSDDRRPD